MIDEHQELEQEPSAEPKKRTLPDAARPYCFKPGQSGNPGGRPKQVPFIELFEKSLRKLAKAKGLNEEDAWDTFADAVVLSCLGDRDGPMIREVVARRDGPIPQIQNLSVTNVLDTMRSEHERWVASRVVAPKEIEDGSDPVAAVDADVPEVRGDDDAGDDDARDGSVDVPGGSGGSLGVAGERTDPVGEV